MQIDTYLIYTTLILVGLCLGSFAGASMWRLRAFQLAQDEKEGDKSEHEEFKKLKKLTKASLSNDRSQCLNCEYTLRWYDLVPLFSWITLGGKCRKCRKPIGYMEPLIELGVATFFVMSYAFWPYDLNSAYEIARFSLWLISGVGFAIMFAYDAKWFLIPDKINFSVIALGVISATLVVINSVDKSAAILNIVGAIMMLSGLYFALYLVSKGKWIGFGDIKLGLGLALLLADWQLAFLTLFAANLLGCIIVIPAMIMGKLKRTSHVPFGPLLIVGFVIAGLFGRTIVDAFMNGFIII